MSGWIKPLDKHLTTTYDLILFGSTVTVEGAWSQFIASQLQLEDHSVIPFSMDYSGNLILVSSYNTLYIITS